VSLPFICNLRGFDCPLSADTISPSQWYIDCKLVKEECEFVLSQEVCTTQEPGQALGSTPLDTPARAEVHEAKWLAARVGSFAQSPADHPRELWFLRCAWFFVPVTLKMHYHPCKRSFSCSFSVAERERGRRLPREEDQGCPRTSPATTGQLLNGERIGKDRSSPPLDSISK
jgi:hypothetical protein